MYTEFLLSLYENWKNKIMNSTNVIIEIILYHVYRFIYCNFITYFLPVCKFVCHIKLKF